MEASRVTESPRTLSIAGASQGFAQQATVDVAPSSKVASFIVAWPWNSVTFPTVAARFVRTAGGTRATQYCFSLYTMSVYGPGQPGTDLGGHSPTIQVTAYGATPTTVSA